MEERRDALRIRSEALTIAGSAWRAVPLGAALVAAGVAIAAADGCQLPPGFAPRARVAAAGVVVVYRTMPTTIEVGTQFAIEAVVCGETGPATLTRVDAQMPEHRHGMNYRPTIASHGAGRYVADGLMFHMPGRWEVVFDVEGGGERKRLTSELEVP